MVRLFMFVNRFLCIRLLQLEDVDFGFSKENNMYYGFFDNTFSMEMLRISCFYKQTPP